MRRVLLYIIRLRSACVVSWQVAVTRMLAVHNTVADMYGLHDVAGAEKIKLYTGMQYMKPACQSLTAAPDIDLHPMAMFTKRCLRVCRVQRDDVYYECGAERHAGQDHGTTQADRGVDDLGNILYVRLCICPGYTRHGGLWGFICSRGSGVDAWLQYCCYV